MISLPGPRSVLAMPAPLVTITLLFLAVIPAAALADPPVPTTGLALWVRADAGITTDASGNVSAWADQSSQHNDLSQTTPSLRPQLVENGINGLPLLRFDGAGDWLSFTTRLTTVRTVFWVVKNDGVGRFLLGDTC